jgi:hypothetical protein
VALWETGNESVNQVDVGLEYGSLVDIGAFYVVMNVRVPLKCHYERAFIYL